MKLLPALATLSLVGVIGLPALPAFSQSRSDRVDQISAALTGAMNTSTTNTVPQRRASPNQLIRETLTVVDFDAIPARLALDIWQNQTQVSLVINWKALELAGVDPTTPITLNLNKVPADVVLKLIVGQMQPDAGIDEDYLLVDVEKWFVRVMTKREALRRSTTKVYFIGDLLMTIPNFTGAPGFDLNTALSNTNTGGSNGGGGNQGGNNQGIFSTVDDSQQEVELSKEDKAERIMDLLRSGVEPDIWRANGGEYASMRYMRGMLVVKAPEFVHRQIGVPFEGNSRSTTTKGSPYRSADKNGKVYKPSGNVAGKAPAGPQMVR